MSHITAVETKVKITDKMALISALKAMSGSFQGLTYEEKENGDLNVRYTPIEVYQSEGNLRFEKQPDGSYQMAYDTFRCRDEMQKVRDSFLVEYQKPFVTRFLAMKGFSVSSVTKDGKNQRIIASHY